jgi:hypothetical protein
MIALPLDHALGLQLPDTVGLAAGDAVSLLGSAVNDDLLLELSAIGFWTNG